MPLTQVEALSIWKRTLVAQARGEGRDLTLRQLALLAAIYDARQPPTVRDLSAELGLTKPVVSRAVDVLEKLELCRRQPDPADGRSVLVQRTVRGSVFVDGLAAAMRGDETPGR